jgi:hypothetical protein
MVHDLPHPGQNHSLTRSATTLSHLMGEGQEGETSAAFLKIRATGFAGQLSANQKPFAALSSPGGEETGEGGRKTQISFAPIVHPN